MKKLLVMALLLFCQHFCIAQHKMQEADKIATLCKTWGFLKYYHPMATRGKIDWDKQFISKSKSIPSINSNSEFKEYLYYWIDSLNKACSFCSVQQPNLSYNNIDSIFKHDPYLNDTATIQLIHKTAAYFISGENEFIKYDQFRRGAFIENDNYQYASYPPVEARLLCLARLWNAIAYYYPYKNCITENWNEALVESIPKFIQSRDSTGYFNPMPIKTGKKQSLKYSGKVVVLVNEYTQSQAEFYAMAFKTFPNTTVIGNQTAGTDGDVNKLILPGGYFVFMTGAGVYYPDNSPTQNIGIVPDIYVNITLKGITAGRDEILERALEFANNGK